MIAFVGGTRSSPLIFAPETSLPTKAFVTHFEVDSQEIGTQLTAARTIQLANRYVDRELAQRLLTIAGSSCTCAMLGHVVVRPGVVAMSFPFLSSLAGLRRQMLIAASSGSLLGLGLGGFGCADGPSADPSALCPNGAGTKTCYTHAQMEELGNSCLGLTATTRQSPPQLKAALLPNGCLPKRSVCDDCCNPAEAEGVPQADGSCCYAHCTPHVCCGRPFTVGGEARLAGVDTRSDWLALTPAFALTELPPHLAARIADEWLADARMEHASIASFARFGLELLGLGAPAVLVEQAQRAALDEVEHARVCFSLASHFAGRAVGPTALRVGGAMLSPTLPEAAARAFAEGCVGETIAAWHARAALERARTADVRTVLSKIADDEARHAELAWRFVAWALAQGGPTVADALREALARATSACPRSYNEREVRATLEALHAAGRLSEFERAELTASVLIEVVEPCARTLLARA
jgi:hypothetical protein